MPLTFIDIERQKSWRIGIFFLILLFIYFIVTLLLVQSVLQFFPVLSRETINPCVTLLEEGLSLQFLIDFLFFGGKPVYVLFLLGFSLIMASTHFYFSAYDTVNSVMRNIGAIPPDKNDEIHKRLQNIMEEIHVVTGNKRRIDCMVIPSLSMNAMAVADLKGNATIAITEGLLSRLSRPQLEAVMAHETYHILSGDCLESSIATSLFGMYSSMLEKLKRDEEGGPPLFSPAFILAVILVNIGILLNMFVSREREYRADVASVRMTRNPLALAEVLHMLSRNWRGVGYIGRGLEMLCIINPQANELDESEGFWADLMSTHPPIRKRIDILLKMARVSISELDKRIREDKKTIDTSPESLYYALDSQHLWQGPYTLMELKSLPWLTPLTWISIGSEQSIEKARDNPLINPIFAERLLQKQEKTTGLICPHCQQPLITVPYEKTSVYQCNFCGGILVEENKIPRIIVRGEGEACTPRIRSLAKTMARENQRAIVLNKLRSNERKNILLLRCPKCKSPMLRRFYSLAYLVEIDCCGLCGLTWFDKDELEILRCMIEDRITADMGL